MNTILTVDDPLANQEVTVVITLAASHQPRDERPILISLGTPEHLPILKSGLLADVRDLIREAWTAFGLHVQLDEASSDTESAYATETVAEEAVVGTTSMTDDELTPVTPPSIAPPRPQAKNLSLF